MRHFNLLRACFWLLAVLVMFELLTTLLVVLSCIWTISIARTMPLGSCADLRQQITEVWAELLAAILALLLAGRGNGGPPSSWSQDERTADKKKGEDRSPPPRIIPSWGFLASLRRGLSSS